MPGTPPSTVFRFAFAQRAFLDPDRMIAEDAHHSEHEARYFCFGMVDGGVLTVRLTVRNAVVRIFGWLLEKRKANL